MADLEKRATTRLIVYVIITIGYLRDLTSWLDTRRVVIQAQHRIQVVLISPETRLCKKRRVASVVASQTSPRV